MSDHRSTASCDECGSAYFPAQSRMAALCPECAHRLYGYPNCPHEFVDGQCRLFYWDGSVSAYVRALKSGRPGDEPAPG